MEDIKLEVQEPEVKKETPKRKLVCKNCAGTKVVTEENVSRGYYHTRQVNLVEKPCNKCGD